MKRNQFKYVECEDCEDGQQYIDTSRQCRVVMGECCGGCGHSVTCESCSGEGEIEMEVEPSYSKSNKARNKDTNTAIYQHHWGKKLNSWRRMFKYAYPI